ncbi:lipoprotein [Pantoea sp. C2G6]|uniref:lipoprotein n=1 Tax=Pantoea sp. C2G6 TaxID=3243084 RepID=UPI003ED91139
MKKIFVITSILVSLTGCVEYQWVKPGTDKRQEDMAETQCKAQALRDLPPDNQIIGKYTSKDKKRKTTDTSYSTTDENESKRDILVKDCMYRQGWTQIKVQQ